MEAGRLRTIFQVQVTIGMVVVAHRFDMDPGMFDGRCRPTRRGGQPGDEQLLPQQAHQQKDLNTEAHRGRILATNRIPEPHRRTVFADGRSVLGPLF